MIWEGQGKGGIVYYPMHHKRISCGIIKLFELPLTHRVIWEGHGKGDIFHYPIRTGDMGRVRAGRHILLPHSHRGYWKGKGREAYSTTSFAQGIWEG